MNRKNPLLAVVLASSLIPAKAVDLAESIPSPTEETKPWCYCYWFNGNISKVKAT